MALVPVSLLAGSLVAGDLPTARTEPSPGPAARPEPLGHFAYDVVPLLRRQGCSSAYCHGGATGRGGLKLSLFGTDPRADHRALVEDLDGRRVDLAEPARSLLVRKPTRDLPHGGGLALDEDGPERRVLEAWIAGGARWSSSSVEPRLVALEATLTESGARLRVSASFEVDHERVERDVTDQSVFESSDERVAKVDREGRVVPVGRGATRVAARFAHLEAGVDLVRPWTSDAGTPEAVSPEAVTRESEIGASPLDPLWRARLEELGLRPAPSAPPEAFLRRLSLDLAGRPPTPSEVRRFRRADPASRVADAVDGLLEGGEFVEVFAARLADWLEVPRRGAEPRHQNDRNERLRELLRRAVEERRGLEELARSMIDGGAARELVERHEDPRDRAEFVGRALLGIRIGCARCHDHPHDRWTRSDHLGFSAFFAKDRPGPGGGMSAGVLFHPETGEPITPRLLPTATTTATPPERLERRTRLAEFVVRGADGQLARAFANRVFAALVGRGLVEPLDDHRPGNPASHPRVLERLARTFHTTGGDLRALVREVALSRIYALSSDPAAVESSPLLEDDAYRLLVRREARPLDPSTLERAVAAVVGIDALPSPLALPRLPEAPLARSLALLNGPLVHEPLADRRSQVDALFALGGRPESLLEDLWLLVLSRSPRPEEVAAFLPVLESAEDPVTAGRELAAALLLSREFSSHR